MNKRFKTPSSDNSFLLDFIALDLEVILLVSISQSFLFDAAWHITAKPLWILWLLTFSQADL